MYEKPFESTNFFGDDAWAWWVPDERTGTAGQVGQENGRLTCVVQVLGSY